MRKMLVAVATAAAVFVGATATPALANQNGPYGQYNGQYGPQYGGPGYGHLRVRDTVSSMVVQAMARRQDTVRNTVVAPATVRLRVMVRNTATARSMAIAIAVAVVTARPVRSSAASWAASSATTPDVITAVGRRLSAEQSSVASREARLPVPVAVITAATSIAIATMKIAGTTIAMTIAATTTGTRTTNTVRDTKI